MQDDALVLGEVHLGIDCVIEPFCVLGTGPHRGEVPLIVGEGAVVRSHSVLYAGSTIGTGFRSGHGILVRENCIIGDSVSIGSHSVLEHSVVIGDQVRVHSGVFIPEHTRLEARCWIGPGVIFTNARYPNRPQTKAALEGVRVEEGAVVGAGVVILPGLTVGAGSLIGAGSTVAKDVAPGETIFGPRATIAAVRER